MVFFIFKLGVYLRITFVISSLNSGGAERALTGLANYWCREGHEINIIKYQKGEEFYALDEKIKLHTINVNEKSNCKVLGIFNNINRIIKIRNKIIENNPDFVISFIDKNNILSILATRGLNLKLVISERTNPEVLRIGKIWNFLRKLMYKKADALVVQTAAVAKWSNSIVESNKVFIIPNSLDKSRLIEISSLEKEYKDKKPKMTIVSMGRLSYEKGHDLLIESFEIVSKKIPNLYLEIIGDGPLKQQLKSKVNALNLSDNVIFHGHIKEPFYILNKADLFILPSRVEGFPNALLEAMGIGLPSISFDCKYGPSELITHNENGFLVEPENVKMMAEYIYKIIIDHKLREEFSDKSKYVLEKFSEDSVMYEWNKLLNKLMISEGV